MQAGQDGDLRPSRGLAATLLSRPDETMLAMGAGGERLVARLRALLAVLLLLMPVAGALAGDPLTRILRVLAAVLVLNLFAQLWLALARRPRQHPWLPFASSAWDVTATTLVLVAIGIGEWPSALNNTVAWCGYPLAIVLAGLRSDGRVAIATGALAVVQYALLAAIAFALADSPEQLLSADHGAVRGAAQGQRLLVLALFTVVAAAIVQRMLRLVELSGTDGLTGLPNRNWLAHQVPRWLDGIEPGASGTLALLDLDHFRHVNEDAGHPAGDRALREVAALLGEHLGEDEHLVRLGGQEFVLLLRKPIGTAWEHVDALRRALVARGFVAERGGERLPMAFSAGLAACPNDAGNLPGLLRRADLRLKQAKAGGGNRVAARDG